MATAAPIFFTDVVAVLNLVIMVVALVMEGVAFVHCLTQRSDAFPAIGTLPKSGWLVILGLALVLTLFAPGFLLFTLIGIAAAAIYLLDVRVGLRDLSDGKGFW